MTYSALVIAVAFMQAAMASVMFRNVVRDRKVFVFHESTESAGCGVIPGLLEVLVCGSCCGTFTFFV
jgi:hypothetical protein